MAIFNSYFDITRGYIFIGKMMSIPWIWGFLPCPKPWSETEVQATAYPEGLRLLPGVCRAQSVVSCLEWVILDIFGVYLQCGAPPRYKLVYKHHDHEYYIYISSSPTFSYIGGPTFCHLWTWTTLVWRTQVGQQELDGRRKISFPISRAACSLCERSH